MFKRTAYELKNGSRRTVLPTRELAESLKTADPTTWRYARVNEVKVSFFRPGFGAVETFATRTPRVNKRTERAPRGIAPANVTESSVPSAAPSTTTV